MRLREKEQEVIIKAIHSVDEDAVIYLFGSRVDTNKRCGDIDILILSEKIDYGDKLRIKKNIFTVLDEQKIDLVVSRDKSDPFVRTAIRQGIRLT